MSQVTRFPNPLTNQYNPSAWALVDEEVVSGGGYTPTDNLTATSSSATQNLGGNIITGNINIGANTNGTIAIGSATSTTTITGTVNIAGYAKLGTTNTFTAKQTISSGGLDVTGTTDINTTGSAVTTIGNSTGTLVVNGGGIRTNKIESTTTATDLDIGLAARTANINIGIGGFNGTSILPAGINIGTSALFNLYSFINLGSDYLITNTIRGFNVNINTNNSGTTNIGSSGYNTIVNGTLKTNTITTPTTDGILSIGANQIAGGAVTMGSSTSLVKVNGTFKADTIDTTTTATALNFCSSERTANIFIGSGGLIGALGAGRGIQIGTGATNNPYSYILNGSSTLGFYTIRSNVVDINVDGYGETNIGWESGGIKGITTVYGSLRADSINSLTSANTLYIGNNNALIRFGDNTTKEIYIGQYSNSNIWIGLNAVPGPQNFCVLGTQEISRSYVRGLSVQINDYGIGETFIAQNGNNTTIGATGVVSGGITYNSTTTVNGTLKANTIESTTTATELNVCALQRTNSINIGTGGLIGTSLVPVGVNLGGINVGTGLFNNTYSFVNLGNNSLGTLTMRAENININTGNNGITTIGWNGGNTIVNGTLKTNAITTKTTNGLLTIGADQIAGGTIEIGSSVSTTTVNGTLKANTITSTALGGVMNIGIDQNSSGTIVIGSGVSTITVDGTLKTNKIESITPTTGNITIGQDQTSGQVNIGLLVGRTGDINIGNNMETGIIKIGNAGSGTSTTSVQAGTAGRGTHFYRGAVMNICDDSGTVNLGNGAGTTVLRGATTYINDTGGNVEFGTGTTAAQIVIGRSGTSYTYLRGSFVKIADSAETVDIGIAPAGGSAGSGTTNVYGTLNTNTINPVGSYMNIASYSGFVGNINIGTEMSVGSINIGNSPVAPNTVSLGAGLTTLELRGGIINMNDIVNGITNIGAAGGNINLGNTGSGTITMKRPITPGYTAAPTSGQVGFGIQGTIDPSVLTTVAPAAYTLASVVIPSAGVWTVSWSFQWTATSGIGFNNISYNFGGTNQPVSPLIGYPGYYATSSAHTVYLGGANTATLILLFSNATVGNGYGYINAFRIA